MKLCPKVWWCETGPQKFRKQVVPNPLAGKYRITDFIVSIARRFYSFLETVLAVKGLNKASGALDILFLVTLL